MNPLLTDPPWLSAPFKIIPNDLMVEQDDPPLDWSGCRSIPRAKRRSRRGFPQRVRNRMRPKKTAYIVGDTVFVHPAMLPVFQRQMEEAARAAFSPPSAAPPVTGPAAPKGSSLTIAAIDDMVKQMRDLIGPPPPRRLDDLFNPFSRRSLYLNDRIPFPYLQRGQSK
jgi:hypothetical protein